METLQSRRCGEAEIPPHVGVTFSGASDATPHLLQRMECLIDTCPSDWLPFFIATVFHIFCVPILHLFYTVFPL